ncbi:TIGR03086 family metal-binding protein [Actinomadura parmotrematis]|uniref:TIGR03086 family protein n=1 Tax=Actinomadura parmotrematis TaxID=2864039 RepID=A0ABS7FXY7_9ACTN|nr:TIGR03086 family metal-binding protein [Actinomadura parmotrematis]MBW8484539.1 TIGR03086 family protein [Actinomadura parmotrematis]
MDDPNIDDLDRTVAAVDRLLAAVPDWDAPTPCTGWDVRALAAHLALLNLRFAGLAGEPAGEPEGDPLAAWRASAAALRAAFDRPDADGERLALRITDLLAHGWDLARATGRPAGLPDDLAERSLAFVRERLDGRPRGDAFGPERPAPGDAPAIDRLAAYLGRDVR